MQKTMRNIVLVAAVLGLAATAMATSGGYNPDSLFNPFNPANLAVDKAIERTLGLGGRLPHAGMDDFSSLGLFADYDFGKSNDKRNGGLDSYNKIMTVGVDGIYKGSMLLGALFSYTDSEGDNDAGAQNQVYSQMATVYMAQPLSECMNFGMALSFLDSETELAGNHIDGDTWSLATYVSMMSKVDNWTFSLTPTYVVGFQTVNFDQGNGDDASWVGKLVLASRAAVALSENMSLAGSLSYNQVLHNHDLDTENDSDHHWFTYGVKMNYQLSSSLSTALGYNSEFDSDYRSDMVVANMTYMF